MSLLKNQIGKLILIFRLLDATGADGERIKKNGFAGVRADDDFWNLEA